MTLRKVEPARVSAISVFLLAALVPLSALVGLGHPASIACGGAFMLANFYLIRLLVYRLIKPGVSRALTMALLAAKFLLIIALVGGVMYQWPVEPLSFALGASVLLVAALVDATVLGEPVELAEQGSKGA